VLDYLDSYSNNCKMSWLFGQKSTRSVGGDVHDTADVFASAMPPSLPVVKNTIDTLTFIASKQRIFLAKHADRVKIELVKESIGVSLQGGTWAICGFQMTQEDAIDLIRASPDSLSNLSFQYTSSSTLWGKLTSWLKFLNSKSSGISVSDDLAFALSVSESVELAGHILATTGYALSAQSPRIGRPLKRSLAFELLSSTHRGRSHSLYLVMKVESSMQNAVSGRRANTLSLASSLYVHDAMALGGMRGVAINTSGIRVDDLPEVDIDETELALVLSKKGTFVASSTSNYLLADEMVSSERVAKIALEATASLVDAANASLSRYLDSTERQMEAARAEKRAVAREEAIEEAEAAIRAEAEAEAEAREAEARKAEARAAESVF